MLDRAEDQAPDPDQDEGDADAVGKAIVQAGRRNALSLLHGQQAQEQAETGDDEAEGHDGEPRADPGQERSLGGEENAGIAHHRGHALAYRRRKRRVGPAV